MLVMDDEAAIRDLTSQLLGNARLRSDGGARRHGSSETYERALRARRKFQAVILDATVRGGLGGVATIERLRNVDPEVTAIICSGYSDEAALYEFLLMDFEARCRNRLHARELATCCSAPSTRAQNPLRPLSLAA